MGKEQSKGFGRAACRAVAVASLVSASATACAHRPDVVRPSTASGDRGGSAAGIRRAPGTPDLGAVYQQMGLLVGRGDLPFVASVARFAAASSDTTLVLLSLSLTNRTLSFEREGDRYRAPYEVRIEVRRGDSTVRRIAADELVRVATFKETSRSDESVLFYQYLALPPASYTLSVAVRDGNSGRSTSVESALGVPRLGAGGGGLSTPVIAYDGALRERLDTLPRVAASGRATATFGQDSVVSLYVEGYGAAGGMAAPRLPLRVTARGERDAVAWSDTASIERRGGTGTALYAGVIRVPVTRLGIGVVSLDVVARGAALGTSPATVDSVRAPLFVSLGPDLPVSTFDEVLGYLRYYATPERLRVLRETPPEGRAVAWLAFLRETDPTSATGEHEGLRDYFARLRTANLRFGEEGGAAGWLTDRGMTYIVLGEPDGISDPTGQDASAKGRVQVWEYRGERLQLTFVDQTGFGRWRLTGPSAAEVQQATRRKLVR